MDEQSVLQAATLGSLEAFNELVLAYQDILYNHAFRITGEHAAAQDAVQETFLRAFRKLSTFRGGSFKCWLLRINSNLCMDALRKIKRQRSIPLEPINSMDEELESPDWIADPGLSPEELYEQHEIADQVQSRLQSLPHKYRQVLVLVDMTGIDYSEAAQALGIPTGTVKSRLARARAAMRMGLFPEGKELVVDRPSADWSRSLFTI